MKNMATLILVRHGKSEWNAKDLWTGWTDVNLNEAGQKEAKAAAEELKDIQIDETFTSSLKRAQHTLEIIKRALGLENLPTTIDKALNERDYGDLTGKNKWKIKEEFGDEQFNKWRRGFDEKPPNGESLHDVYNRVIPYYSAHILPELKKGKNVIIAAHGNSLRALVKYLENISDNDIEQVEIATGEVYIYSIDVTGKVINKEIRVAHANTV